MANKTMRGANGGGNIRKRSDGRWEARYTTGIDKKTGKQIQKSVYGKTQKEVRQKLTEVTTEIDDGTYLEATKMTVAEWLEIWLNEYMWDKKYSTVKHYKATCRANIIPIIGNYKLAELKPYMLQKYFNDLFRGTNNVTAHASKTVHNIHGILCKVLNQAAMNELIRSNPASRVTLPRMTRKEIIPLTDAQIAVFLQLVELDEYCAILKTILFTGMRESEAIGLTWDCIDFEKGTIRLYRQLQKRPLADGGFTFETLKNGKERMLTPAPSVLEILKMRKIQQTEQRFAAGAAWQGFQTTKEQNKALVFTTLTGSNLSPQTVYNHFKRIAVKAGAPTATVHDLRHTYVVLSIQNGDDIKTIQYNVGHATASFTLDVYGHVSAKMKKDSADRMEKYISQIKAFAV
jgi:integrase